MPRKQIHRTVRSVQDPEVRTHYGSGWHTVVCGPYPTTGNPKIVLLYVYLLASILRRNSAVTFKAEALGSADIHLVLLVRYHLNSLPAVLQYQQNRMGITISNSIPNSKQLITCNVV